MSKYVDNLRKLISSSTPVLITGDSVPARRFSLDAIADIQQLQYDETVTRYAEKGYQTQTVAEAREQVQLRFSQLKRMTGDSTYNVANGIGTLLDPETYTRPIMPIMCGSYEASAIYAGGGLPAGIVDKKAASMVLQGATFEAAVNQTEDEDWWSEDKIKLLEEAAVETGFNDAAGDAIRDAYLYGGSVLYPVLQHDSPSRFLMKMDKAILEKGCIVRWTGVDRWNTVYVPSWIPTAADYLTPKTITILQESVEVSTSRCCLIRPKPMPYWSAICNMGWSPSDLTGWIQAYYAYDITHKSIPVMAQQMSLLLYRMPLDALNATVGANQVEKLMEVNEEQMKSWSALSPKAVNMIGEVEVVDRTYSGFEQFVGAIKSDFAAQTEIPEPAIWHTPNKGFSDNTQESLIKQSETLQMRQHFIERYMGSAKDLLIAHCWGTDSEEWKRRNEVKLKFSRPEITTEKDLADVGAKFAASINSLVQAGFTPDIAIQTAKQFYPKVQVTDAQISAIKKAYDERVEQMNQPSMGQTSVGGQGTSIKGGQQKTGKTTEQKPRKPNNAGGSK